MKNDKSLFPIIKKNLSNFISDEEGTTLRSKAAIIGPLAVGAIVLMSKEMMIESQAARFVSHSSHFSRPSYTHSSHVSNSNIGVSTHSEGLPAHSSHASGLMSGFSHTAGTFLAEVRNAENN